MGVIGASADAEAGGETLEVLLDAFAGVFKTSPLELPGLGLGLARAAGRTSGPKESRFAFLRWSWLGE